LMRCRRGIYVGLGDGLGCKNTMQGFSPVKKCEDVIKRYAHVSSYAAVHSGYEN